MDSSMTLLSKYYVKIPDVVEEDEQDKVDLTNRKAWWILPPPPDDERMFFPNITPDYISSVEWMVRVRLMGLSIWDSQPPFNFASPDPGWRERAEYKSMPLYKCLPNIYFTTTPCVGDSLDVISLLSICKAGLCRIGGRTNRRVKPERSLRGKYVLLFCVFAPARLLEDNTRDLCRLAILSHQLSYVTNFEIVIVPKMRKQWDDDSIAFHKLLYPFLGRLFLPFSDRVSRDQICHFLSFTGHLTALLIGPDHKVLHDNIDDILSNYDIITRAGVRCFLPNPPQDEPCSSLAWLLPAKPGHPPLPLYNLNSNQTISVAQLSKKLVGLYLLQVGDKLNSFLEVYNQCKEQGLEFEIVLVCMPLFSSIHPTVFEWVVLGEVRKHIPNTSWWVFPYNHCACIRLFNLCQPSTEEDRMIIVGPDTRFFVEEWGGEVAHHFGIQAYPFNREVVVQRYVDSANAVTLESLLTFGSIDYLVRRGERVPVSSLRGKIVLLYTDSSIGCNDVIYNNLVIWYKKYKKLCPGVELVFVCSDPEFSMNCKDPFPETEIELLVRPFDPEHSAFFSAHPAFFLGEDGDGKPVNGIKSSLLLAFGTDGHLVSLRPMNFMNGYLNIRRFRSEDNDLREEIIYDMACEYYFMGCYLARKPFDVVSLN